MSCHFNLCAHKADNSRNNKKKEPQMKIPLQIALLLITYTVLSCFVDTCYGGSSNQNDVQSTQHRPHNNNSHPHHHHHQNHLNGLIGDQASKSVPLLDPEKPIKKPSAVHHFRHEKKGRHHHHPKAATSGPESSSPTPNRSDESETTESHRSESGYNSILEAIQAFRSKIEPTGRGTGDQQKRTASAVLGDIEKSSRRDSNGRIDYVNPFRRHSNNTGSASNRAEETTPRGQRQKPPAKHQQQQHNARGRVKNEIDERNTISDDNDDDEEEEDYLLYDDDDDEEEAEEDDDAVDGEVGHEGDALHRGGEDNALAINGAAGGYKKGGAGSEGLLSRGSSSSRPLNLHKKMLRYPSSSTSTTTTTTTTTTQRPPVTTARPHHHQQASYAARSRSLPPQQHRNRLHQSHMHQNHRSSNGSHQGVGGGGSVYKSHNAVLRHHVGHKGAQPHLPASQHNHRHPHQKSFHINGEMHYRTVLQSSDEYTDDELQADDYQSAATRPRLQYYRQTSGGGSGSSTTNRQGTNHQQQQGNNNNNNHHHQNQRSQHHSQPRSRSTDANTLSGGQSLNVDTLSSAEQALLPPGTITQHKLRTLSTNEGVQRSRQVYTERMRRRDYKALALKHDFLINREAQCRWPKPRVIEANSDQDRTFIPHCTILHRCGADTGCCNHDNQVCAVKRQETVHLYFIVSKVGSSSGGETYESVAFSNHTECECVDLQEAQQKSRNNSPTELDLPNPLSSCQCPGQYMGKIGADGSCQCDCSSGYNNHICRELKEGHQSFTIKDRQCISKGQCTMPLCEYGVYVALTGKCPKAEDKLHSAVSERPLRLR